MRPPAHAGTERELREQMAQVGRSFHDRGYGVGTSGNISIRLGDAILVTPTNSSLGRLDPDRISKLGLDGHLIAGDKPSKEAFLHLAVYQQRPADHAIVHLHSTHSVAVSCLADVDSEDVLPPITAYYIMRVGRLPLVPYYPPGDMELAQAVAVRAARGRAVLLANHGPVVAGNDLDAAVASIEELEETARLFLLLHGRATRFLTTEQVAVLRERFPT